MVSGCAPQNVKCNAHMTVFDSFRTRLTNEFERRGCWFMVEVSNWVVGLLRRILWLSRCLAVNECGSFRWYEKPSSSSKDFYTPLPVWTSKRVAIVAHSAAPKAQSVGQSGQRKRWFCPVQSFARQTRGRCRCYAVSVDRLPLSLEFWLPTRSTHGSWMWCGRGEPWWSWWANLIAPRVFST